MKLGLCTNKRQDLTELLTDALDLTRHFDVIAGGDRFPQRKPDPIHVTGTLELMGAAADEPWPPASTNAAATMAGSSAGAKPMNQA